MSACVNPLIYAATIPAFKELIAGLFKCNTSRNEGHGIEQELHGVEGTSLEANRNNNTTIP